MWEMQKDRQVVTHPSVHHICPANGSGNLLLRLGTFMIFWFSFSWLTHAKLNKTNQLQTISNNYKYAN